MKVFHVFVTIIGWNNPPMIPFPIINNILVSVNCSSSTFIGVAKFEKNRVYICI